MAEVESLKSCSSWDNGLIPLKWIVGVIQIEVDCWRFSD